MLYHNKVLGQGTSGIVHASRTIKGERAVKIGEWNSLDHEITIIKKLWEAARALHLKKELSEFLIIGKVVTRGNGEEGLLMPRAEGDLFNRLKDSPENKTRYIKSLIQAVAFIHRLGFVHSDLKPENILFYQGKAKIADFGLSFSGEVIMEKLIGTLGYIPPESYKKVPVGPPSDCFALGVILSELVKCKLFELKEDQIQDNLRAIESFRDKLKSKEPNPLSNVIIGFLDPDPKTRFTSELALQYLCP